MNIRDIIHAVTLWWACRGAERRRKRLLNERGDLFERLRLAKARHSAVRPIRNRISRNTHDLLRLEQRRIPS